MNLINIRRFREIFSNLSTQFHMFFYIFSKIIPVETKIVVSNMPTSYKHIHKIVDSLCYLSEKSLLPSSSLKRKLRVMLFAISYTHRNVVSESSYKERPFSKSFLPNMLYVP